jgi:hypothetical protein
MFLMADVKASLAFKILTTPMCFNGGCESIVGLRNFCQHLCVVMADVKASLAFENLLTTPTCFNGGCESIVGL